MSEQVRVGVIGTSWFADALHLPNLRSHPGAKLVGICGRNRERADEMATKYDIPLAFTDYREMIEKAALQAIIVITPDDLHYPMTMDALDAGLHVLCTKPLASNAAQAREMFEKAEAMGVKHMTSFTNRCIPHNRHLKAKVDEDYIGWCFHCSITKLSGHGRAARYSWRFDRQRSNGVLADLGSHQIDFARWCVGEIAEVNAQLGFSCQRPGPAGEAPDPANDAATVTLRFENGAHGTIRVSAVAHVGNRGQEHRILLHGEGGTLELVSSFQGTEVRGLRCDVDQFDVLPVPDHLWRGVDQTGTLWDRYSAVMRTQSVGDRLFIDSILEDLAITPSFYDGLKAQEVIDAAIASHETRQWVSVGP